MQKYRASCIIIIWVVVLSVLGVRSLVTGNSYFGRGMFHEQVAYRITYYATTSDNELIPLTLTKDQLRGKAYTKLSPDTRHQSRYGRGTVQTYIQTLLAEIAATTNMPAGYELHAQVTYEINTSEPKTATFSYTSQYE